MKTAIYLVLFLFLISCDGKKDNMLTKNWKGYLEISEEKAIPFYFELEDSTVIIIQNGEERIKINGSKNENTILFPFEAYNSYLTINQFSSDLISGVFVNEDRKENNKMSFKAHPYNKTPTIDRNKVEKQKWEVYFNYDEPSKYPAVGLFYLFDNNYIEGTFLTETGDYRFLSGQIENNKMTMSCFDGSHAFLFEADFFDDSLNGLFYSGAHWKTNWYGIKNDTFELKDPYLITQLVNEQPLEFSKPDLSNTTVHFPSSKFEDKVVIIQVFGSWCPNCMDEINYFNQLYEKYNHKGLEIIGLGYEIPKETEGKINRLKKLKKRKNIAYTLLLGGEASKQQACEDFPMLNSISSFPTTLILNRKGEIVKIHTGFNGPGTGELFENYKAEMEKTIEIILKPEVN